MTAITVLGSTSPSLTRRQTLAAGGLSLLSSTFGLAAPSAENPATSTPRWLSSIEPAVRWRLPTADGRCKKS